MKSFFDDTGMEQEPMGINSGSTGKVNYVGIGIGILVTLLLCVALFMFINKDDKKGTPKDDPNRAEENRHLTDNDDEEVDPDLYISNDVKEVLDEYCELTDEEGDYISPKMNEASEDTFEFCTGFTCMTTVEDEEKGITYYTKSCKSSSNGYKRIAKEDLDVDNEFESACKNLDEDGNYTHANEAGDVSITCTSYSCNLVYKGKNFRRSCVS